MRPHPTPLSRTLPPRTLPSRTLPSRTPAAADAAAADAPPAADAGPPDASPDAMPDASPDAMPDAMPDAAPDAMPITCIDKIFGDYILLTDGRLRHYTGGGGQIVMNATTSAPLDGVAEVVDQQWHSCARRTDGTVWCWAKTAGVGLSGGLGNGDAVGSATTTYAATPVVLSGGGALADALALQRGGTGYYPVPVCAIRADHTLWCWGPRTDGNLLQTGQSEGYPVQIKADATQPLANVTQVAIAYREACVLAGGVVSCWGANIRGGLAQGDTAARLYPTPIGNAPAGVTAIAAGQDTNYAFAGDRVYAWGASGALGAGTATNQWTICNSNYCQQTPTAVQTSDGRGARQRPARDLRVPRGVRHPWRRERLVLGPGHRREWLRAATRLWRQPRGQRPGPHVVRDLGL